MDATPTAVRDATAADALLVDCVRAALARTGGADWSVEPAAYWCHVTPPGHHFPVQGWKLHVSATPLSAPLVLARVTEILVRHRCAFKFAGTLDRVRDLVSHHADRGSGGKFVTVYPGLPDERLRALADELHEATLGLPGPGILSDRPYRPGSLVHYRFGVFTGVPMLGNDGSPEAMLVAPDGSLVPDERKAWFTPPPWAPRDPFTGERATSPKAGTAPKPVLLDGRYLVHEVIRHTFSGSVYRGTDQVTGGAVVVKQARPHTNVDEYGQELRHRRRHEAEMLRRFASSGFTARLVALFEQQGDLFLVQERLPGATLRKWVWDNLSTDGGDGGWGLPPGEVHRIAERVVRIVREVHERGLVLRDLTPNNIMVTEDDVRLIDLEAFARAGEPAIKLFTPGYAAPEQVYGPSVATASPRADLFALGAVLFYLVSAVDPVLVRDAPEPRPYHERIRDWLDRLSARNPVARRLAPIIVALTRDDPAARPELDEVAAFLAGPGAAGSAQPDSAQPDSAQPARRSPARRRPARQRPTRRARCPVRRPARTARRSIG